MAKIFKKAFAVLAALFVMVTVAHGAWEQTGDNEITIEVLAGSEYAGEIFTIDVFADGKSADDLIGAEKNELLNIIVTRTQGVLDSDGKYVYVFKNAGNSGRYVAYISVNGMEEYLTEEIDFVNITQFKNAISQINELADDSNPDFSEIAKVMDKNASSLGLVFEEYENFDSLNKSKVAKILLSMTEDGQLSEDREKVMGMVKKAVYVQMLNEGKIDNVFEMPDLAELGDGELSDWVDAKFVKDNIPLQKNMTERLQNRDFESFLKYKDALTEAFVLAAVNNPDGYKNVKTVCEAFESEIGISGADDVADSVWSKLAGGDYDDYADLKKAYNDAKTKKPAGGGSSGGGGGSSKPSSGKVTTAVPVPEIPEPIQLQSFDDVSKEHWAFEAIETLAKDNVVSGRGDRVFDPDSLITREEFVKLIVSLIDEDASGYVSFVDAKQDAWYYEYVKKAYCLGIVSGYSDELFGIGDNITRQDVAAIAYRVYMKDGGVKTISENLFSDDSEIAEYAKDAVYTLRDHGIISGMPNNEFQPKASTTRAQAAMIIYNLLYK